MNQPALSDFLWSVADLLRGDYQQSDYGKVILPFTMLRQFDCVLEGTRQARRDGIKEMQQDQLERLARDPTT